MYRAEDRADGRKVALRVLPPGLPPAELQALSQDLRAASAVSHPNLVKVLGPVQVDGQPCVVSEYVAGKTLAEPLRQGHRMPVSQVHGLGRIIGQALGALHAQGIVHGAVQPSNLMVSSGVVKLADAGLARLALALAGPERYHAPEGAGTVADDLYALSAVLYHLLTGVHPGQAAPGHAPPPPGQLVSGVPEALDALIARGLDPDPARRPATAAAVLGELKDMVKIG